MKTENANEPVRIEAFIQSMLTLGGLRRGKDFSVSRTQLRINKHPIRGKLLTAIRELYPEYNFYWETPKILKWFK